MFLEGVSEEGIDGHVEGLAGHVRALAAARTVPDVVTALAAALQERTGRAPAVRLLEPAAAGVPPIAPLPPAADVPPAWIEEAFAARRPIVLPGSGPVPGSDPGAAVSLAPTIVVPLVDGEALLGVIVLPGAPGARALPRAALGDIEILATYAARALAHEHAAAAREHDRNALRRAATNRAAAEELRLHHRLILDGLGLPLLVLDGAGIVLTANRPLCELLGVAESDVLGHAWDEVGDGALDVAQLRLLLVTAGSTPPRDVELRLKLPVLGRRTFMVSIRRLSPAPARVGEASLLVGLDDVTEWKEVARVLERRAILFESISEAVYAGDVDFRIQEANPAAERLFGWSLAEIRGTDVKDAIRLSGVDRTWARQQVFAGETVRGSGRVHARDGREVEVEFATTPVKSNGTMAGFVTVMQDVTERRRLERAAEARLAALREVNQELEAFSYSVSHDLRAPVRAIEAFSRLLAEEHAAALDAEGGRLLQIVRKNARRLAMLIDDILDLSHVARRPLVAVPVDMQELAEIAARGAADAEPDRTIDVSIAELPRVAGDRALLAQVWRNLLENAVKYTRGRSPAIIHVSGEIREGLATFHVRDNGVGFDMKYVEKLFGVFERLHSDAEFEGTGVGLALVERILRRHGGRVWADSAPGDGASFHFSLRAEQGG